MKTITLRAAKSRVHVILFIFTVLMLGACASSEVSMDEVDNHFADATAALTEAEEVGAEGHAPGPYSEAVSKMKKAQMAKADGDREEAAFLAQEAEVDAELAEMTALAAKTETAAQELRESVDTLSEEIKPKDDESRR